MKKIVIACNSGLGTSLMIRLNVEALMKELSVQAQIEHTDITSLDAYDADLIIGSSYVIESLHLAGTAELIGLEDITDRQHLKARLMESGTLRDWFA